MRVPSLLFCLCTGLLLSACDGGDDGISIAIGNTRDGSLTLSITDAPADDVAVVSLRLTGVELLHSDGERERIEFDEAQQVDLLELRNGTLFTLLENEPLPNGRYQELRLLVESSETGIESFVETTTGGQLPLTVSDDGALQLNANFEIEPDTTTNLIVDIDLRKGLLHQADPELYRLRSSLRLIDGDNFGGIAGSVASNLVEGRECSNGPGFATGNVVYVYSGSGISPDDIDGDAGDPLTTADVIAASGGGYSYEVRYLPPGAYSIAFSCRGVEDDPLRNDSLEFTLGVDVNVTSGTTSTQDLF